MKLKRPPAHPDPFTEHLLSKLPKVRQKPQYSDPSKIPTPPARRVMIPENQDEVVRFVFEQIYAQNIPFKVLGKKSGVRPEAICLWRHRMPVLGNLQAVGEVLGYRLVWEPIKKE